MKRAQIVEPNKPLVINKAPIPDAPPGGVVIKTSFAGICHSDLHQWENRFDQGRHGDFRLTDNPNYKFPVVPGHEISGTVYALGTSEEADSDCLKVGDRVAVFPWLGCGKCGYCLEENCDKCMVKRHWIGLGPPGGYASYVVIPERKYALKVPDNIPLDVACMFSCSALTAYHAVTNALPYIEKAVAIQGRARALIIGAGGLGLWATQFAQRRLPKGCSITAADVNEEKLAVAKQHGCDSTLTWSTSADDKELIASAIKEGMYNAIIDFVNNPITSDRAFKCLSPHGVQIMVGLFGGEANFSLPNVVLTCKTVKGVLVGSPPCMREMMEFAAKHKIIPPPLEHIQLEDATDALIRMRKGKITGRVIIDFNKEASNI